MINFGKRVEPFVDSFLIDSMDNVRFLKTEPINEGKVFSFDKPWECLNSCGFSVLEDEENIKFYYRGFPRGDHLDSSSMQTACLATSTDGFNFRRAEINEINYEGITENNICRMDPLCHNFLPFYDTNPDCKEDEKYKAIAGLREIGGLYVFVSPDGIHWKKLVEEPVITNGIFDSMNTAFWDSVSKIYRCYSRYYDDAKNTEFLVRSIQSSVSTDFIHWTEPTPNLYDKNYIDQLYTNATRPMPGAEHVLISIPMRFMEYRRKYEDYHGSNGVSDCIFMTSRDGLHWDKTIQDAWISGSTYSHEWTPRNFITSAGIIERNRKYHFYIEKNYTWEDEGVWLYTVERLRFISIYADKTGGTVLTKELRFDEDDFYINFATSAYGFVKISVLDLEGNEIYKSDELFGNEPSFKLHFDGLKGRFGRIKIELNEAKVYAIGSDMNV